MSGDHPPPRIKIFLPLMEKTRPFTWLSSEVTSRMPNFVFVRSEVLLSIWNSKVNGYNDGLPIWTGHQRRGLVKLSWLNLSGSKATSLLSFEFNSTSSENSTFSILPFRV